MTEIATISLENELDLITCHKHAMKLAELTGLSLSLQTGFATAVSEIARNAVLTGKNACLKLGIDSGTNNQCYLYAEIFDENSAENHKKGIAYAKRLVNYIRINEEENVLHIVLSSKIRKVRLSPAKIEDWKALFSDETPVSPYEEIKRRSEQLKKLTVRLKEGETYHRQLLQSLPVAVYTCDEKGYLQLYNKAALELWGRTPNIGKDQWCGSARAYFLDGTPVLAGNCSLAAAVHAGKPLPGIEKIIERPDGSRRIVQPYPQPLFNSAGKVIGGLNVMIDITEQKRAARELEESEEHLRLATEAAELGTWEYDIASGRFVSSARHREIIGLRDTQQQTWTKQDILRFVHPDEHMSAEAAFRKAIKTGRLSYEAHVIRPDGSLCWVKVNGTTFYDENRVPLRLLGTTQDITAEKNTERELREAKRLSEESLRFKEQFLANMSHEIRTPMNAIVGFTELLLKTKLQADQQQYIDAIKTSGENLLVIINDILDFSRLQAGGFNFEKIDFRLSQLVSTLMDLMLPKSVEKSIKLSLAIDPAVPDNLTGDPTRLNQILLNLVGNAIKFTDEGEVKTRISVLREDEENVELLFSVSDTGIGISPDKMTTIFEVFTQASNETTRKYGGSGLGLSIVKQLVEQQGGTIWADSEERKGSTFTFVLSFGKGKPANAESDQKGADEEQLPLLPGLRVLLVEDNKLNQVLAKTALSNWHWEVDVAENGLIALQKLAENDFDLVLMDIQLPEMDGYEATRRIRADFTGEKRFIPIIALTAHAMASEEKKCYVAGMNGYISKPFTPKTLYAKTVSVLQDARRIKMPSS